MAEAVKAKIRLYTPHSGQWPLHRSKARFRVATCGRRWGKTHACINELAKFSWENPGTINWWVAPTYKQSRIAFRIMSTQFKDAILSATKNPMEITWKSGGITQFHSADQPDNLRGEGVSFMVVDEAAMIPEEVWTAVLRPTLSDKRGRAIIVSTPRGKNWFYHIWARGQDPEYPDYESWQMPTSSNPYIPPEEVEEARRTLPTDVFRQEYLAEFLEDGAAVFRNIRACIRGQFEEPQPSGDYVIGWDVAKHTDFSVMFCIDRNRNHVVAFDRFNQVDYSLQLNRLETMAKKYRARVLMDSTGVGDPLLEQVKRRGIPVEGYHFTNASKQQLVENLAVMIERQEISYPEIPVLINELQAFQYEITRAGNIRYSAPDGYHDDCVMALALAAWAAKTSGGGIRLLEWEDRDDWEDDDE
jgi:phage FluMu gp28-like protein